MGPTLTLEAKVAALGGAVRARDIVRGAVPWLVPELLATSAAHDRLARWCADGGLTRPAPDVRAELQYFGDTPMLPLVVEALQHMAPPARDHVLAQTAFIGSGWLTLGWTSRLPAVRPQLVVLSGHKRSGACLVQTVWHECAHVWLESFEASVPAAAIADLWAAADRDGSAPSVRRLINNGIEFRAEQLTDVWAAAYERSVRR